MVKKKFGYKMSNYEYFNILGDIATLSIDINNVY